MKTIGKICVALGFICCVAGAGLQSVEYWFLPPLIFLVGILLVLFGMWLLDRLNKRLLCQNRKRLRHIYDEDKQRVAADMKRTYQDLIIKEIMK